MNCGSSIPNTEEPPEDAEAEEIWTGGRRLVRISHLTPPRSSALLLRTWCPNHEATAQHRGQRASDAEYHPQEKREAVNHLIALGHIEGVRNALIARLEATLKHLDVAVRHGHQDICRHVIFHFDRHVLQLLLLLVLLPCLTRQSLSR